MALWKSCSRFEVNSLQRRKFKKLGSGSDMLWTRSHIIIINNQFWTSHQNGGGDRPTKAQFLELQNSLTLDWMEVLHTGQHTGRGLPSYQIRLKLGKTLWTDKWTDGSMYSRMHWRTWVPKNCRYIRFEMIRVLNSDWIRSWSFWSAQP